MIFFFAVRLPRTFLLRTLKLLLWCVSRPTKLYGKLACKAELPLMAIPPIARLGDAARGSSVSCRTRFSYFQIYFPHSYSPLDVKSKIVFHLSLFMLKLI